MNTNEMIIFEVDSDGTVYYVDFYEIKTREDAYDLSLEYHVTTPASLVSFAERCPPLQWLIGEHYTKYRDDPVHSDRLKTMLKEPEEGWKEWVLGIDKKTFSSLRKGIKKWLSEEPNWSHEDDYIDYRKWNEGAVFDFFAGEPSDVLDALGVEIIEGPYPGSNYRGAELRRPIEEANTIAEVNGLEYRFREKS